MKKLTDLLSIIEGIAIPEGFWLDTVRPKIGESWIQEIPQMPNGAIPLTI